MARWGKMFHCVAAAVCGRGLKGLLGLIPYGEVLYDIGEDALRRWRQIESEEQMRAGLEESLQAGSAEVVAEAAQAVEEVSAALPQPLPAAQKQTLTAYLTQIPALARQTLKRPEDPSGTTVPANFSLRQPEDMLPLLPARLPRFQPGEARPELHGWILEQILGVGGFGEVWLARHPRLAGTRAAVKFCLDLEAQGRLLPYEAEMINRVQEQGAYEGVVALQDADLDARPAWLKYEYVPGGDLTGLIHAWKRDNQLLTHGLPHLLELAEIVAHFHDLKEPIVHRDLKPANVLVRPRSKGGWDLRITDFGIGGVAARYQLASEARSSQSMGLRMLSYLRGSHTPLYASPEQKLGQPPDPRDDVHALGVIGYQLLTGRLDRGSGVKFTEDLRKAGVEEKVSQLLMDCVDPDREDRLATAGELAKRLRPLLTAGTSVVQTEPGPEKSSQPDPARPGVFTNGLGMKFVRVPAGTFWVGGGGGQPGDEQVEIPYDFYIGVYPVTQGEWQALMGSNPSWFSRTGNGKDQVKSIPDAELKQFPVENVSWEDAQEFIRRLNAREGNSKWVYRLPLEDEWEYSCRGGATSQADCSFHYYLDRPTNDLSSDQANFDGNYPFGSGRKGTYLQRTTKVSSYKPNRLGIYDMHGNVWEWCQDILQGSQRVIRGGSWRSRAEGCQASPRGGREPVCQYDSLGLRLARGVPSGGRRY